jgi:DnaK suppressor protein
MVRRDALLRLTSRLIARRDALRKTLDGDLDSFRNVSELGGVGDQADAATDSASDEVCSQLVEIESWELGQIEHALKRIKEGVHGRCEYCGQRIPTTRLNALPYTNSCINCQRARERRGQLNVEAGDAERWAEVDEGPMEERDSDEPDLGEFGLDSPGSAHRPLDCLLV